MSEPLKLCDLGRDDVPPELRPDYYFDLPTGRFAHASLFQEAASVVEVLCTIAGYTSRWLLRHVEAAVGARGVEVVTERDFPARSAGAFRAIVGRGSVFDPAYIVGCRAGTGPHTLCLADGARILGATVYLDEGDVYVGRETVVEPGAGIRGPTIVMAGNALRQGAYVRGNVIIGAGSGTTAYRGELKNTVVVGAGNFPHACYLGDSLMGYGTHFGNGVTAANFGVFQGLRERHRRRSIVVELGGRAIDLGIAKMGVVMGDHTQIGCNSVLSPGTLIGKRSVAYGLCMIERGFYPPHTIFKNKPIEKRVIETTQLDLNRI